MPPTANTPHAGSHPTPTVAVVGATGAVGREMLAVLEQRNFRHGAIRAFASPRSAGAKIPYRGTEITVEALTDAWPSGIACGLFSAGSSVSKAIGPKAAASGTIVIDNSSAFRMDAGVPLVVPEINASVLPTNGAGCIIANPNCSAIILLMALAPLHRAFGVDRAVVSTYQAASGAGAHAMAALEAETRDALEGKAPAPTAFHEPYAFNLFCHNAPMDPASGMNGEEQKVIAETRKILADDSVRLSVTCVRVPVMRAHCESVNLTLKTPATLAQVREVLQAAPGVMLVDDRANNRFPTPLKASGIDDVLVGRLRVDPSQASTPINARTDESMPTRGFDMFIAGDQLRKGAALNAVQIAEKIFA